jgi:hypothetical protein
MRPTMLRPATRYWQACDAAHSPWRVRLSPTHRWSFVAFARTTKADPEERRPVEWLPVGRAGCRAPGRVQSADECWFRLLWPLAASCSGLALPC